MKNSTFCRNRRNKLSEITLHILFLKSLLTFCLIGASIRPHIEKEVNELTEEKKVTVENEDGDVAEINADFSGNDTGAQFETDSDLTEEISEDDNSAAEVEKLQNELKEMREQVLRARADFDNFRKRTAREKTELAATVEQAFLKDLLPLLDNLNRASDAADAENSDAETLRKGIEMIKRETVAVMEKHGLEQIETGGKMFDPNFHQAVGTVQDDSKEDGMIAAEFQPGYIARGRVIRPSMVQVISN